MCLEIPSPPEPDYAWHIACLISFLELASYWLIMFCKFDFQFKTKDTDSGQAD